MTPPLHARANDAITFTHISLQEGLSQSTVFSIDQDKRGNLWFATYDGVNKYDGYSFTVYRHDENDSTSIARDIARIVKTDSHGRVWVGTPDGLSCYDEAKDRFRNFHYERRGKRLSVNGIIELSPNHLLLSTSDGLLVFDTQTSLFADDMLGTPMRELTASALYRQDGLVYIGTPADGLYTYSINRKVLEKIPAISTRRQILAILQQSPSRVWIATEGDGLFLYNPQSGEVRHYLHNPARPRSISSNYIRALALDSRHRLWIGTFNDLNIYREADDSFIAYSSNPVESGSLSQRSVRSIFMDSQGGVWLGTYFGGLNYYHPIKNRFTNIRHIPYQNSLSDNVVSCIVEDSRKTLWIGTNDGGLNRYDPATRRFAHYAPQERRQGQGISNNVKAVYVDERSEHIYIGTHAGGLSVLRRGGTHVETNYNQHNSQLPDDNVYAILPDGEGHLLLGTLSALVSFDPARQSFATIDREKDGTPINHRQITLLFRDSRQRVWVGGENGISVYHQRGSQFERARVLPASPLFKMFTNCVTESSNGLIYIGTREGFYSFDERSRQTRRYTTADGLPNNVVYGILEDALGRLWISTNQGLSCFSPDTGTFRNFIESDGLQGNQFNNASCCRASDGQMYFGGINGITTFSPELLPDNPYTPPVVITQLRLFNKPVRPDDKTGILTRSVSETEHITLRSWQSTFSLEFVVSNYISGKHNTFAYQLEPYDKEWYYLTDKRVATYSNLPQGTYRFLVKAANNDGKWNPDPTALLITVLPVWYQTWWAIVLFVLAALALVGFVIRFFWMRKSMEAKLEMERRDKEHKEEIGQMKTRFFINISHELRTPLTLILAPLHELIARTGNDQWTRERLEYIQRNSNRLLHIVNQLMDYRRAELGVFELKVGEGDAHRLIEENVLLYDKLARQKSLDYTFHSELEGRTALFDARYLELIVNNLLSNAFKYTESGQSVTVALRETEGNLTLQVSDTGAGIPADKQARVFERFYQAESEHIGSGIGLSLVKRLVELHHGHITLESEEGKGSTFIVSLPQDPDTYLPIEFAAPDDGKEERQVYSTNTKEMYSIDTEKAENERTPATEGKQGTLLIVEDNDEIRQYLRDGLSPLFDTLQASNGEEALELLKEREADLVITDVMMPVMDGIKLCKSLKQNIRTCHVPVFILSAKSEIQDQLEALQVGADDYIPKPFSLPVLTAKLLNTTRTRRRTIEKYVRSTEVRPEQIAFTPMDEALLRRALEVVTRNMDNIEFSTDEFAREMNMSRSNLHLKLKAITGESAIDFIRKVRFAKAAELLKEGNHSVGEVSSMVGFNTPSYFATSFKKHFGCLPTEYARRG
jgi:signal transduction histidine kinase/ligand-binding sensor domain-containing protein/DNA-binding response OmpR family regulator